MDWEFDLNHPGKFDVSAELEAKERASIAVVAGEQEAKNSVAATGGRFRLAKIGTLELRLPGKVTIAVKPVSEDWHPINPRTIRLKPVAENP